MLFCNADKVGKKPSFLFFKVARVQLKNLERKKAEVSRNNYNK